MAITSLSTLNLGLFGFIGLVLIVLSLRALIASRRSRVHGDSSRKELDRLFSDISRGLKALAGPARSGGHLYREKQEEVGRLLTDLQNRLRLLEDGIRQPYELKASQVLADAARVGITLPPLEMPLITSLSRR